MRAGPGHRGNIGRRFGARRPVPPGPQRGGSRGRRRRSGSRGDPRATGALPRGRRRLHGRDHGGGRGFGRGRRATWRQLRPGSGRTAGAGRGGGARRIGRRLLRRRRGVQPRGARTACDPDPRRAGGLCRWEPLHGADRTDDAVEADGQPPAHAGAPGRDPGPDHRRAERLPGAVAGRGRLRRRHPRLQLRPGPDDRPPRQGLPLPGGADQLHVPDHGPVLRPAPPLPAAGGPGGDPGTARGALVSLRPHGLRSDRGRRTRPRRRTGPRDRGLRRRPTPWRGHGACCRARTAPVART
jgi:hypothetical protein